MIEDPVTLIAQLGFPIAMCLWFMLRTEKIISKNTEVIRELKDIIELMYERRKRK